MFKTQAKYHLGQVVRHRKHPFRGVVFDVDAMFSN
ncbi:MAG: hemimethylated DNA-binding YccV-like domain-containing protein, partial [Gemmobacter sp.]